MNVKFLLKGFKRPKEILKKTEQTDAFFGQFVVEPLERGFGITVGNAIRRVCLSSIPGYAIVAVKFDSVLHEFSTIDGVTEDVSEIILNLKQVIIKLNNDKTEKMIDIDIKGPGEFKAGDLAVDSDVEVINPDFHIATLEKNAHLKMSLQIEFGRGYVPSEDIQPRLADEGVMAIDANFTPVRKVSYKVENLRIGNRSDYNRLLLDITTNGSLTAEDAVAYAAKILKEIFVKLLNFADFEEADEEEDLVNEKTGELAKAEQVLAMPIEDLEFSVRSYHCLNEAGIRTVGELVRKTQDELIATKNFGQKSLTEILEKLEQFNLSLGMTDNDIKGFSESI